MNILYIILCIGIPIYATVTRANDNNNIMENVVEIFVSGATLGGGGGGAGVER